MDGAPLDAKGVSDTVTFDGATVVISPRPWVGAGYRRRSSPKVIPVESIRDVEVVPATFWQHGWVRFVEDGFDPDEPKGIYGALIPSERRAALFDENSANFRRRHAAIVDTLVAAVRASIAN